MSPIGLFERLLCDAYLSRPDASPAQLAARLQNCAPGIGSDLFGPPLVDDRRLTELDRMMDDPLPVTVLNSSGAGGLVSLTRRSFDHLEPVAIETMLRDRDDPVGNVGRVAMAARELDPGITIYIGVPADLDQQPVAAEIEASGLSALIIGDDTARIAARISSCIELDLPFRTHSGVPTAIGADPGCGSVLEVVRAVDRLIDGGDVADAAHLLQDPDDEVEELRDWDDARIRRVRRRLAGCDTHDPYPVAADLRRRGLVTG
jgi:hypothetical protein